MTEAPEPVSLEEAMGRLRETVSPLEEKGIIPPVHSSKIPEDRIDRHARVEHASHSTAPKKDFRAHYAHNEEL